MFSQREIAKPHPVRRQAANGRAQMETDSMQSFGASAASAAYAPSAAAASSAPFGMPKVENEVELSLDTSHSKEMQVKKNSSVSYPGWRNDSKYDEMAYFDFIIQWAHQSNTDSVWARSNGDFGYCHLHHRLTESTKLHKDDEYDPECVRCHKAGYIGCFLDRNDFNMPIEEIRDKWVHLMSFHREMAEKGLKPGNANSEEVRNFGIAERAAFVRYKMLAWERNAVRVQAVIKFSRGDEAAYNLLPDTDPLLVEFAQHWCTRHMQTASGRRGDNYNVHSCLMHTKQGEPATGHFVQTLGKHRYYECGICIKPRGKSNKEMEMDRVNSLYSGAKPVVQFKRT